MDSGLSKDELLNLILRTDSMFSYLWYRGYIDKSKLDYDTRREIENLLVELRIAK